MLYLAIDQHSKQLTVSLRNEDGNVLTCRQVSTRGDSVERFLQEVAEQSRAEGGYVTILEVCGFNDWLLDLLPRQGCRQVVLVAPSSRSRCKTDRRDANHLGELLWVNRRRALAGQRVQGLRQVAIPTPQQRADRRLTALRRDLAARRTCTLNQIQRLLKAANLQHQLPTQGLKTRRAQKWLRELALDAERRLELDLLLAQWNLFDQQLQEVETRIQQRHAQHPTSSIVASIPGCGAFTALAIASRIGRVERFATPRSLANYFGLAPSCRNSGEATQRLGAITKQGSPIVRFLLGQLVLHVLKRDPQMRRWYKRLRQRRGSKVARVAVMRRLTTILWHMLTKREAYQCGGPPPCKPETPLSA